MRRQSKWIQPPLHSTHSLSMADDGADLLQLIEAPFKKVRAKHRAKEPVLIQRAAVEAGNARRVGRQRQRHPGPGRRGDARQQTEAQQVARGTRVVASVRERAQVVVVALEVAFPLKVKEKLQVAFEVTGQGEKLASLVVAQIRTEREGRPRQGKRQGQGQGPRKKRKKQPRWRRVLAR
jgi:hypothetical protein